MSDSTFTVALQMIMGAVVIIIFVYVLSGQYISDKVNTEFRAKDAAVTVSNVLHKNRDVSINMPLTSIGRIKVNRDESLISVSKTLLGVDNIVASNATYIDNSLITIKTVNDDFYAFTKMKDTLSIGTLDLEGKRICPKGLRKSFLIYDKNPKYDIANELYDNSLKSNIRLSNKKELNNGEVLLRVEEGEDIVIFFPKELSHYACNIANQFDVAYALPSNHMEIIAPNDKAVLSKIAYAISTT